MLLASAPSLPWQFLNICESLTPLIMGAFRAQSLASSLRSSPARSCPASGPYVASSLMSPKYLKSGLCPEPQAYSQHFHGHI